MRMSLTKKENLRKIYHTIRSSLDTRVKGPSKYKEGMFMWSARIHIMGCNGVSESLKQESGEFYDLNLDLLNNTDA